MATDAGPRRGACPASPATAPAPTRYAASSKPRRPPDEVAALMQLLASYLESETRRCREEGVRLEAIGRRDRLDAALRTAIAAAEDATAGSPRLRLRIAIDYSGREAILAAARSLSDCSRESFDRALGPPVDLLIRTGGEQRLSDFLLWECAYAELVFSRRMWPDFDGDDLRTAIRDFRCRERRFGAVPAIPQPRREAWLD